MNALDSRIRELVAYARERDGEDRTALFRNLVDLFLTGKAPSREPTRSQLLDVIEALLPHVDAESRRTAADLVAQMSRPPLDLGLRLARDRASIAADLLKTMPFDEDAFIELIAATGREHHQILAGRSDLSANVWIALARAAPAAPPFDSRSTLALWRDDLGAHDAHQQEARPAATVTMLHGGETVAAATAGVAAATAPKAPDWTPNAAAETTPDDSLRTASLRILRSGEDLLADRAAQRADLPETRMAETRMAEDDGQDLENTAAPEPHAPEATVSSDEPAPEPREKLRDPGPGGWSWRSDRDGIVTDISPFGQKLLEGQIMTVGASMLDLLGLNTKLGHPVSRAFQRRSAIHDAPINLETLEQGQRYWTLDAAPLFSQNGGVFEGYEGALTPVVAAHDPLGEPAPQADDQPLFLEDLEQRSPAYPKAFADRQSVLREPGQQARPKAKTEQPTAPAPAVAQEPAPKPEPSAEQEDAKADLTKAALSAVADMVRGSVETAVRKQVAEVTPERLDVPAHLVEMSGTLDLLEEAIARLGEGSRKAGNVQLRLQAEIAAACARSLREQMSGKTDD